MAKKPLTQREIKKAKESKKQIERVTIINKSDKQTIPIQLRAPKGVSFWVGEQTVNLYPKKMSVFPVHRLYLEQIKNFEKAGRIQVLWGNVEH